MITLYLRRLRLNFNHTFNKLTITQKIELYLIPLLIIFFIFSNNGSLFQKERLLEAIQTPQNTNTKASTIEIITFYEKLAKLTNVKISILKFDKNNTIIAKFEGTADALLTFLQEVEKRDKIISLHFIQKDLDIEIEGVFLMKTFHNKIPNISPLQNLKNPFLNSIQKQAYLLESPSMTLETLKPESKVPKKISKTLLPLEETMTKEDTTQESEDLIEVLPKSKTIAIVGEYVLLNNEWLKIGDSYKGYIVTEISKKTIQFQKNGKLAIMEMFNDN
jgi:hypothetical protein